MALDPLFFPLNLLRFQPHLISKHKFFNLNGELFVAVVIMLLDKLMGLNFEAQFQIMHVEIHVFFFFLLLVCVGFSIGDIFVLDLFLVDLKRSGERENWRM